MKIRFGLVFLFLLTVAASNTLSADDGVVITWQTKQLSNQFFSEGATIGDFNKDGVSDVASGPFWYAGGDFSKSQQFYAQDPFDPHGYSNNFFAFTGDFNGDGWDDILVYGFPGKDASWFENPRGADRFWQRHKVLEVVDNESPTFVDLTGDGKREIICSSGGYFGFAEVNESSPESPWKFRRISDQSAGARFTHGLGIGDVDGDGRMDLLEKNGWWQQPDSLDGDPVWKNHSFKFSEGHGNAQIFVDDVDGDGDNDVVCSLNAHGFGLAWFEHKKSEDGRITFERHSIMGDKATDNPYDVVFSQLHGVELADINGDGLKDIVTGKRHWAHGPRGDSQPLHPAVVYWFELQRSDSGQVSWIPHLIDNDSGIGVEVDVADLNADGAPDVIIGNKKGTFVHLQKRTTVDSSQLARVLPRRSDQRAKPSRDGLPENEGLQPKEAAQAMTVPDGFRVQLAAGEPMIHQPVAMTFDHRGRLWVAEAHTYPIRAAEGQGDDRIVILEDTDSDGVFDSRKVFTEGLNLVSGMEVGFGGVWVGAAPYLLFIPDHDGDDRPDDEPQVLLDGFGYQDTHETLNSFIWGPDGWLYGCHGVFTHSKVGKPGTPDAERTPLNCCVWRYHPIRHEFDIFARGTSNPWGIDFDDHGQAFITACVIPHMYHIIQGARYQRQGGSHFNPHVYDDIKTIADHAHYAGNIRDHAWWGRNDAVAHNDTDAAGGGHAHCGAMIYLGDNWPTQYRNSIFMANIHGNRINNDILKRVGSGFVATHGQDLLFANDRWFRAINLKYGPDGSVYVIDWYDKNACHRRDKEIWDRTNGRVYRITFGDQPAKKVDLSTLSNAELVELQLHENDWYVRTARRLLQERSLGAQGNRKLSIAESEELSRGLAKIYGHHQSVPRRLRAMWTAHACGLLKDDAIKHLLDSESHKSEYVRAWAIALDMEDKTAVDIAKYRSLARDSSALVRLYVASALQRMDYDDRWAIADGLVAHADDASDHNLPLMIWYGIEPLVPLNPTKAFQLAAKSRIPLVRQFIYRRAAADPTAINSLLAALAESKDLNLQKVMLAEIASAVRTKGRIKMPKSWPSAYAKLSAINDPEVRQQSQMITVKFGDKSIFPALRDIVANSAAENTSRSSALSALISGKDKELPTLLIELLSNQSMRSEAIRALAGFDHSATPKALLEIYGSLSPEQRSDAVMTLVSRKTFAKDLLDAVRNETVPRQDLSAVAIRQIQQLGDEDLAKRVNEVWGTMRKTSAEKKARIQQFKEQLKPAVLAKADLSHGRAVFEKTCGKCHRLFGTGGDIGPDITGSNRADLEYTLQNMIDPNALIGRDYQSTQLLLEDGRLVTGLLKEDNETAVVIQTANEKLVIDKDDITNRKLSEISMMPEGQLDQMKSEEVVALVAYLASPVQVPLPGEGPVFNESTNRVAGAIEGEAMKIVSKTGGNPAPQGMGGFTTGKWSGKSHLWWTGGKPGNKLTVLIPAASAGRYEVFVAMTKARDYGIMRLAVNGQQVKPDFDLYDPKVIDTGAVSLGEFNLNEGDNVLTIEIVGANSKAVKSYMFGLDYVYLARKKK